MCAVFRCRAQYAPALMPALVLLSTVLLWMGAPILAQASGLVIAGPTYSVAQVRAGLLHSPAAWSGRTVLLRGEMQNCLFVGFPQSPLPCRGWQPTIADDAKPAITLPIVERSPDPVWAFVRRLPVLGSLVPAPQALHWDMPANYRVRIEAMPDTQCGATACYALVVLDPLL